MIFERATRVHILGVGGAGMSSLAVLLHERGCVVSGCDGANREVLGQLREFGVQVEDHHDDSHVEHADVVLWSPAVAVTHSELLAAKAATCLTLSRSEVLGELSRMLRLIGVTGTHGKTTATSMLVQIMTAARRDDSRLLGAVVRGVGFGGHYGEGDLLAEVDESYGAFSQVLPFALGLLNVEADHLDHYGSLDNLEDAFGELLGRTAGPVVVWTDDPGAARVAARAQGDVISVGTGAEARWRLVDEETTRHGARARLVGSVIVEIELKVTGRHNLINAAVAAVLALSVGVEARHVTEGLSRFQGAPRRFERVATWRHADVVDDYAHLPGEIAATVAAAKGAGYQKIVALFQPHRISRTLNVGGDFAPAFDGVDEVIVTDIYSAGEANPEGITGQFVADFVAARAQTPVRYAATLPEAARLLKDSAPDTDLLLILGAGDVTTVLDHLEVHRDSAPRPPTASSRSPQHFLGEDRVEYDAPLGARTTYRVGGTVSALVTLGSEQDLDDLSDRLANSSRPLVPIGNGSNLVVADGHHDVIALRLVGAFSELEVVPASSGDVVRVVAGAGLDLPVAARRLAAESIVGFEWAVGVPGTFGGAVAMNAGGHGSQMSSSVTRVEVWTRDEHRWRDVAEMDFSYRHSSLAPGEIVTRVELELRRGDPTRAREKITEIVRWRREHQPGGANAGSVFRNPEGDSAGRLIETAGLKGMRLGSAVVSLKHANFFIVDPAGSANDVLDLIKLVRERVGVVSGVWLETEHCVLDVGEAR